MEDCPEVFHSNISICHTEMVNGWWIWSSELTQCSFERLKCAACRQTIFVFCQRQVACYYCFLNIKTTLLLMIFACFPNSTIRHTIGFDSNDKIFWILDFVTKNTWTFKLKAWLSRKANDTSLSYNKVLQSCKIFRVRECRHDEKNHISAE